MLLKKLKRRNIKNWLCDNAGTLNVSWFTIRLVFILLRLRSV